MIGFGKMLRSARLKRGQRQDDVAPRIGLARQTLSKYELDRLPTPPEVVVAVARCLGCPELMRRYCEGCPVGQAPDRRQTA